MIRYLCAAVLALSLSGCGDDGRSAGGDGGGSTIDSGNTPTSDAGRPDAYVPANCVAGSTQCSDCMDNDGDGRVDGFDPECTSAADDREDSFATGIPGDNIDPNIQDCFFDGNSGGGDDGCTIATCCFFDPNGPNCPSPPTASCTPSSECIETCQPATIPGCDCFGCCEICNDGSCHVIMTNPAVAPNCTIDVLDDPALCPPCMQIEACSSPCDPESCILCPGQTPDDLPPSCTGVECPNNAATCAASADCPMDQYCAAGCCIPQIIID